MKWLNKSNACGDLKLTQIVIIPSVPYNMSKCYSRFSRNVTAAMLVYITIANKFFWEFDSIIMQTLSEILPLFYTPIR